MAYRTGTNRKPDAFYRKGQTAQTGEEKARNIKALHLDMPDKEEISLAVHSEQLASNSSKRTDIKLKNKSLTLKKDDEEEKNKKEHSSSPQHQNWEKAVSDQKKEILQEYGSLVGQSLIDEAEENTANHLFDVTYYDSYLYVALQKAVLRYKKFTLEPRERLGKTPALPSHLLDANNFK